MLFSVIFRSTATSALCSARAVAVLLHPVADDRLGHHHRLRAGAVHVGRPVCRRSRELGPRPASGCRPAPCSARRWWACSIPRQRSLGFMLPMQMRGAIPGAPLPLDQSLILIWPQLTGPDRRHDRGVRGGLRRLPARGSQGLKDWTVTRPPATTRAGATRSAARMAGRGRFLPHAWVNAEPVPRFYPNVVTLAHDEAGTRRAAQHDRHPAEVEPARPLGGEGQFQQARPRARGLRRAVRSLVDPQRNAGGGCRRSDIEWRRESEGKAPADRRSELRHVHRPPRLPGRGGRHALSQPTAWSACRTSSPKRPTPSRSGARSSCLSAQTFPRLPLVGYESGDELAAALDAGFEIGDPLRIWVQGRSP